MIFPAASVKTLRITLFGIFILTIALVFAFTEDIRQVSMEDQVVFGQKVDESTYLLKATMDTYIQALYGARSYVISRKNLTMKDWQLLYQNLGVNKQLPALSAIGYVEEVSAKDKETFFQALRADNSIAPDGHQNIQPHPDSEADKYLYIKYIEPSNLSIFEKSIGFDFYSDAKRKAATEKALDTNQVIMTEPIISLSTNQLAFLLILPVYDSSKSIVTPTERREAFRALVTEGFRTDEFFNLVFKEMIKNGSRIEVYDGTELTQEHLLFSNKEEGSLTKNANSKIQYVTFSRTITIADRIWTITYDEPINRQEKILIPSVIGRIVIVVLTNIMTALFVWQAIISKNNRSQ